MGPIKTANFTKTTGATHTYIWNNAATIRYYNHSKFDEISLDGYGEMEARYLHTYPNKSLCAHNSSREGAMKLQFVPFCSSRDALPVVSFFGEVKIF